MNDHSQNGESQIVLDYFKGFKGTLLDIGANDGITLSNSYDLILQGWEAVLIEPSSVFNSLEKLYVANQNVYCLNYAISDRESEAILMESGAHVKNGTDRALVSSLIESETERWVKSGVKYTKREVKTIPFRTVVDMFSLNRPMYFNFITIDTEGFDWVILQQIDLDLVSCKCLCIEWNSVPGVDVLYSEYCKQFGLKEIHRNAENIIFAI